MGILIGLLTIVGVALGFIIGRLSAPDRQVRKSDLNDARHTINNIDAIARQYYDQLDIVGRTMQNEISEEVVKYWRGVRII